MAAASRDAVAVRRFPPGARGGEKARPTKNPVASTPFFEHLNQEFGRQVLSAQTCGRYEASSPTERWYCLRTRHNMEYVALVDLRRRGFAVHLSLFVKPTKRNASDAEGVRCGHPVIRRVFPGYVFVSLDLQASGWGESLRGHGVTHLLPGPGSPPWPVPERVMARLLRMSGDCGYRGSSGMTPKGPYVRLSDMSADERNAWLLDAMRGREERELELA